jgi:hypothetical protein
VDDKWTKDDTYLPEAPGHLELHSWRPVVACLLRDRPPPAPPPPVAPKHQRVRPHTERQPLQNKTPGLTILRTTPLGVTLIRCMVRIRRALHPRSEVLI